MTNSRDTREAREPRSAEGREAYQRQRSWVNPNKLLEPEPVDGMVFRWIRSSILGQSDARNLAGKRREGWEPVPASEQPALGEFKNEASGHLEYGGLILCWMPDDMVAERNAHYAQKAQAQVVAVENNLMRESDPRMPLSKPENRTEESFGRGKP